MQQAKIPKVYTTFFFFSGEGGGPLGAQQSLPAIIGDDTAVCEVLGGIDVDQQACLDAEMWTGVKFACHDLFDRHQYTAFHSKPPGSDWTETTLQQIKAAAQNRRPNIAVITAPCKGMSGLLDKEKAKSEKYDAGLNGLTERGVFLALETWKDDPAGPPDFIIFENVKGMASRGKRFLAKIKQLLASYGYHWHDDHYDCGVWGGLAQHRKRFLGFARRPDTVPCFLYNPPKQRVKAISEVLEQMPLPIDPDSFPKELGSLPFGQWPESWRRLMDAAGGPMHTLPRLQWRTWLRLALIRPGGDWRDLQDIEPGEFTIVPVPGLPKHFDIVRTAELQSSGEAIESDVAMAGFSENRTHHMKMRVQEMDEAAATVIGATDVQAGAPILADYRQAHLVDGESYPHKYQVVDTNEPSPTVTGTRFGSGAPAVADPRPLGHTPMGAGKGAYLVQDMNEPSGTISGDPSHRKSGGASVVADHRLAHDPRDGSMQVGDWSNPSGPVTGSAAVTSSNGIGAVADPRYTREPRSGVYTVQDMSDPSKTIVGGKDPNGNMASVADNRSGQRFNNVQRVTDMSEPAGAVTAAGGTSNAAPIVADPRGEFYGNMLRVTDYEEPGNTVTGAAGVNQGANLVADPRLTCTPRGNTKGPLGVQPWDEPAATVTASGDVHTGAVTVADPRPMPVSKPPLWDCRIPADNERGVWFIRSPHRDKKDRCCVHRPMTTLELLAIQSFPWRHNDNRAVVLAGKSDRSWRERIGNAWPPAAAAAVITNMLMSLLASDTVGFLWDFQQTGILVQPDEELTPWVRPRPEVEERTA